LHTVSRSVFASYRCFFAFAREMCVKRFLYSHFCGPGGGKASKTQKNSPISEEMGCFGTPEGTRTPDLLARCFEGVLDRAELAVAKPKNSGIIKSLDIDDFYLMAEGHEIHQDVLDVIADVISEYEREGKAFFSETEFGEFYDSATGKPALLQTDINSYGMLKLNVNSSILAGRTLEEIDAQIARTDSNLPNSLREAVVHECGHAKAYKGKTPKEISAMNESLSNRGVDGISPIAEMDGAECIAEIEVMLYRGEQVSDAAMHLYNEFITE